MAMPGFGLFGFAPLGLPIVAVGVAYMALWGRRMLPARSPGEILAQANRQEADLAEVYHLGETLFRAGVPAGSPLAGQTLAGARLRETLGLDVLAIERDGRVIRAPPPDSLIAEEDILLLNGDPARPRRRRRARSAARGGHQARARLESAPSCIFEAVLAPRSTADRPDVSRLATSATATA